MDMWSTGCIFAEMFLRTAYLQGDTDIGQLREITSVRNSRTATNYSCACARCDSEPVPSQALGTPTEEDWPEMKYLPDYFTLPPKPTPPLRRKFGDAGEDGLALLLRCAHHIPRGAPTHTHTDPHRHSCVSCLLLSYTHTTVVAVKCLSVVSDMGGCRMLRYDPQRRITAAEAPSCSPLDPISTLVLTSPAQALRDPWFRNAPLPTPQGQLPVCDPNREQGSADHHQSMFMGGMGGMGGPPRMLLMVGLLLPPCFALSPSATSHLH